MTTAPEPPPDAAAWCARELGFAPTLPPAEARREVLRFLAGADFVPPPDRDAVLRAWNCPAEQLGTPLYARAWQAQEQHLHPQVEEFARTFFRLPPAQRWERWGALRERCGFAPHLLRRLAALQAGLNVDATLPEGMSAEARWLAGEALELFPLPPGAQRERVRQLGERWRSAHSRTGAAAAGLDGYATLLNELLTALPRPLRDSPAPARRQSNSSADSSGGSGAGGMSWVGIIGLIVIVIRVLTMCGGRVPNEAAKAPVYQDFQPSYPAPPRRPSVDPEEIQKLLEQMTPKPPRNERDNRQVIDGSNKQRRQAQPTRGPSPDRP